VSDALEDYFREQELNFYLHEVIPIPEGMLLFLLPI